MQQLAMKYGVKEMIAECLWPILRGVIPGGAGGAQPPTFGQQHFFRGFHTPLTERYHQKWC